MALILNEDEEQFRLSVRRLVAERSPLPKLRELMSSGQPFDTDVWKQLSALGLTGLIIPAEHGGAEAGYSVLSVALTELGAGLVASPLLAGTLAAGALLRLDDQRARARLLPGIASGELIATLAAGGTGTARADGDVLAGEIAPVLNAAQADVLLIPAVAGDATVLFEVAAGAPGLEVTPLPGLDHSRSLARVRLDGAAGRRLAGDAAAALAFAADLANLAIASEQLGAVDACLEATTEYAKVRAAFGRPIGAFQGVKHRLAELRTTWELAHAALRDAARAADSRPADFPRAASVARIAVSASYVDAAIATIQLHGGIGFTWEHDAHLYHKNAISQHALFGGPGEQLAADLDLRLHVGDGIGAGQPAPRRRARDVEDDGQQLLLLLAQRAAARRGMPHDLRVRVLGRLDDRAVTAPAAGHRGAERRGEALVALLGAELAHQVGGGPLTDRVAPGDLRGHLAPGRLVPGQRHGEQHVVLRREVAVQRRERHPRPVRQVLHLHRFLPARGQDLGRGGDHPVVPGLLRRRLRSRRQVLLGHVANLAEWLERSSGRHAALPGAACGAAAAARHRAAIAAGSSCPRAGGGATGAACVAENRGAGAGWSTPSRVTRAPRAARSGWSAAPRRPSTGATQASEPEKTRVHSACVLVANVAAILRRSSAQPCRSC